MDVLSLIVSLCTLLEDFFFFVCMCFFKSGKPTLIMERAGTLHRELPSYTDLSSETTETSRQCFMGFIFFILKGEKMTLIHTSKLVSEKVIYVQCFYGKE